VKVKSEAGRLIVDGLRGNSERKDPLDYDELIEKSNIYMESLILRILDLEYVKTISIYTQGRVY